MALEHEEKAAVLRTRIAEISDKRVASAEQARDAEALAKQTEIQRAKDIETSKVAMRELVRKTFLN